MNKLYLPILILVGISGFILYNRPKVSVEQQDLIRKCAEASRVQNEAYRADKLAKTETFDKYKVPVYTGTLAPLNMKISSREAKMFRTMINGNIEAQGINFAGHYSLVYVGMTGWGQNYFLVDRITGKGIPVPYQISYVKTQKDSSLLLINTQDLIYSDVGSFSDTDCESSTGNMGEYYTDLRPYYYNWNGSEFIQLGNPATINPFWKGYFE